MKKFVGAFCMFEGGDNVARTQGSGKFRTPKAMYDAWCEYKEYCDGKTKFVTTFSQRESRHITEEVPAPVSYSIKGFCNWIGMTYENFNLTYEKSNSDRFNHVIARMLSECEIDTKEKLETARIEPRLAGLLLSKYGYSTTVEQKTDFTNIDKLIEGIDRMADTE